MGDGRQVQMRPLTLLENMGSKIVDMDALHDDDDGAIPLVVQAGIEGAVIPLLDRVAPRLGESLLRLDRVVDDDEVAASASERPANGGGKPATSSRGLEVLLRQLLRVEAGLRKQLPVPVLCITARVSRACLAASSPE